MAAEARLAAPARRLLWALLLLGCLARLALGGVDSLWLDEAISVRVATTNTPAVLWNAKVDPRHPPLYYVLLRANIVAWGSQSEFVVRLPSALASLAGLAVTAWLARRLLGAGDGPLLATTLLALAPLDLWYAGEARMYSLVTLATLLLVAGLVAARSPGAGRILGAALVGLGLGAGLQTSFVMIPLWATLTAIWLADWRRGARRLDAVWPPAAAMALAWWPFVAWRGPQLVRLLDSPDTVFLYRRLVEAVGGAGLAGVLLLAALLALAAAAGIGAAWLRRALADPASRRRVGPWILAGFAIATVVAAVPRFYTVKRLLVTIWPIAALLVAWVSLHATPARRGRPGTTAVALVGVSLLAGLTAVLTPRDDWRGVVAFLDGRVTGEAQVWLDPPWNEVPYATYAPRHPAGTGAIGRIDRLVETAASSAEIWLVAERPGPSPPTSRSEAWLDAHWELVERHAFVRLEVRRYRRP